jgi:MOSC domain-containing protein
VPTVTALSITPVKATRLHVVDRVVLTATGVHDNRRFYLIDQRDRMINSKIEGKLQTVVADYSDADRRLKLTFPDGRTVEDDIRLGDAVTTQFFSVQKRDRLVEGPWAAAISEHVGRTLRLVEGAEGGGTDRGVDGAVSLISRASLARLAEAGGLDSLDPRRFRMMVEIDGVDAHAEDAWVGNGAVRIGEAAVAFAGHVGRCLITSRDPDTGVVDVPTLDILRSYRVRLRTTEPLPFGIWGQVVKPGAIAVGDEVALVDGSTSVPGR